MYIMSEDLYVIDWYSLDMDDEDDSGSGSSGSGSGNGNAKSYQCQKKFLVKAFCLTPENQTVVLNIQDFQPFYYVKVPSDWGSSMAGMFIRGLQGKVKKWVMNTLVSWKLVNAKPLYGFTAMDKFRYIKLTFSCLAGFYSYRNILGEPLRLFGIHGNRPHTYELYEANMPPLLRFMHCKNLKAAGWLRIESPRVHFLNNTTCHRELTVKSENITPIDEEERDGIPAIKYMGFDIEADSSHGDFPLAKKDYQKLARDIITDYNMVKDEIKYNDMRPIIATYLKYAFHPHYNNNNIRSVKLLHINFPKIEQILSVVPYEPVLGLNATIEHWTPMIYEILKRGSSGHGLGENDKIDINSGGEADQDCVMELLDIFETHFPEIDATDCDYYSCAEQVILEFNRQTLINDPVMQKSPKSVVKLLLELCFDPYYNNLNINRIYNKSRIPALELCKNLIPKIYAICEKANRIVTLERKAVRYRKMGAKYKVDVGKESTDDCVTELCQLLNQYLPEVEDDRVIQIGSTIKRYGETDCYLKHIICLGQTDSITNKDMINHEYTGVELPDKELKAIRKKHPDVTDIKELNRLELEERKRKQYETDNAEVIVICCDTEEEVLLKWKDLVMEQDPDLIVGYNTFGFDYKYLYDRAEQLGITEEFSQLGRIKGVSQQLIEKKLQSAGLGDNLLHYIEMHGRVSVDLYKVMQKMEKLNSYKLDSVCKEFLYKSKVDVSPAEIFVRQKGTSADRRIVAEYCLIDCILCVRLMDKFELILNNIGMAQVCSVPFSYLFLRGQGIKLFSFVGKICREQGYLIPVLGEPEDQGKYEGAIVLEPDKGIHDEAVVVADFNSLYPSCIISENLSHNSFVGSKVVKKGENTEFRGIPLDPNNKYERNLITNQYPGWDYVDIVYDLFRDVPVGPGRKKTKKIISGHKICRFSQPPDGKKDIIPSILMDLLAARKKAKKTRNKYPDGSFKYNVYEGLQLAYKVTANSLYGIIGASTSPIRLREIAACTTATGRKLINFSAGFVKRNYPGSEITYGDSVASYTPVLIKRDGQTQITKIKDLVSTWYSVPDTDKEYSDLKDQLVYSWTESGWTQIKQVMRHKLASTKKMFRVLTHTGVVDVTSDHSLLKPDGSEISPVDLKVGDELMHHEYPDVDENNKERDDEARIRGFFLGDGSCGGNKSSWALNNKDRDLLEYYKKLCEQCYPEFTWTILETLKSSNVYKLVPKGSYGQLTSFIRKYRSDMYDAEKEKKIPNRIMSGSYGTRWSFWLGYYDADGDKESLTDKHINDIRTDQKNQITCAQLAYLGGTLGYNVSLNTRLDKPNICRLTLTKSTQRKNPFAIKKIYEIAYDGDYVYDLTTENHHFQAGIGKMIVHNTDSIFCKFKCYDRYGNKLHGLDAVNKSILLCTESSMLISKQLKKPHNLEFEKAILPFILLSKKRYHGHYYTEYGSPKFKAKSMGIVLKRRDNAPIVKHVFGGMIDIIMYELSIEKAMKFVKDECVKVLKGEFPLDKFIIAKTLRSYYKNPTQIAHNVLAQRIGKRDPGNKPRGNDRIAYAFIVNPDAESQGDMIETPQYIIDHKCKLDYAYYITNQISKPVLQIFELANTGDQVFNDLLREYANIGWRKITEYDCVKVFKLSEMGIRDLWSNDSTEDNENEVDLDLDLDLDQDADIIDDDL